MKILQINNFGYKLPFRQNANINKLSGLEQFQEYDEKIKNLKQKHQKNEDNLIDVLYNSIFVLNSVGKYKSAKIVADDLRKRTNLEDDYSLNMELGSLNKNIGDIQSSNYYYSKALKQIPEGSPEKLDALKNIGETAFLLNKNIIDSFEPLAEVDNLLSNMVFLYLHSLYEKQEGNNSVSQNEIDISYKIMKEKGYEDESIIFRQAMSLSETGLYDESNAVLTERMDRLRDENLVYTNEFLNDLILLGINSYKKNALIDDKSEALGIFKNASQIAEIINNIPAKEIADYAYSKILFVTGSEDFISSAEEVLNNTSDEKQKISLNIMLGDAFGKQNANSAKTHYKAAIDLLEKSENNENILFKTYEKLKLVSPAEDEAMINKKIAELNVVDLYSRKNLVKTFYDTYLNKQYDDVQKNAQKVINSDKSDEVNKKIAGAYISLTNISVGKDMKTNLTILNDNLNKLEATYRKNPKDEDIKKALYYLFQHKAILLYNSMNYYDAADAINKSTFYFDENGSNEEKKVKQQIYTTLYNYKAARYNDAEKYALKYLGVLIGKKEVSASAAKKMQELNGILKDFNDTEKRKVASAYETLGLINLKNKNFADARDYFINAVTIREDLKDKDIALANSYAGLARIAILTGWKSKDSSKDMHEKSLQILRLKYPNNQITREEEEFHKKYYGFTLGSFGKYVGLTNKSTIIDKFKCYNKELSICE